MKKNPITPTGYQELQNKLHKLTTVDRPAVIQAITTARAHGDLSENAEYSAAKEKQAFVEYQIQIINQKLQNAQIVENITTDNKKIMFGNTVVIERQDNGTINNYTIVGEDEADINQQKLSCQSPLARILLGKSCNDTVVLNTPRAKVIYKILKIS